MSHEVETMAYANAVPWHGLGNPVDPNLTPDEMLVAAGLDWEVRQYPAYVEIDGERVAIDKKALVRSTDNRVLTVTGNNWKPFQNRDALEFFRDYTRAGGLTLETAGSLRGGKVIWGLAKLNRAFEVTSGDKLHGYLMLTTSHEVGRANSLWLTSCRVVCQNTMNIAMSNGDNKYSQNHMSDFDVEAAKSAVGIAMDMMSDEERYARTLAKLKMDVFDTVRLISGVVQPMDKDITPSRRTHLLLDNTDLMSPTLKGILNSIRTAPGHDEDTGWGVLNGVTHWADHIAGTNRASRLSSAWLGNGARTKLKVRSELLELAGVE